MQSSHLILCRPLLLLPPIPASIRVFSNESTLPMRWPKYWSFSFSISPSNEHPGLIPVFSFRMDWLDLLAVQGTLKSLLQHHSSIILRHSAFFTVQLSTQIQIPEVSFQNGCCFSVVQLYPTLSDPMECSLPGSSIHGIFPARILEWVAVSFSSGSC